MANPFFIDSKIGESLVGLGNVIGDKYEKEQALEEEARLKQAEFEKQQAMQSELQSAMASGDENQIAAVSMKYPQLSEKIQETFKFKNDITKQNFLDSAKEIISGGDVEQVLQTRVEQVQSQGGDPTDTLRELEMYPLNYNQEHNHDPASARAAHRGRSSHHAPIGPCRRRIARRCRAPVRSYGATEPGRFPAPVAPPRFSRSRGCRR